MAVVVGRLPSTSPEMEFDPALFRRFWQLIAGLFRPPPGWRRILLAWSYGIVCHTIFAAAVFAMIWAMFFGMSESFGRVPEPLSYIANTALVLQFPVVHSLLLSSRGQKALNWFAPQRHARTLGTTTFAIIASLQLLALFALWTPSGVVWWRAEGAAFVGLCVAYGLSWFLLMKASYDAGAEVQSGALGWMSLAQKIAPQFPDMPTTGLFRIIRQPIYMAFALTLWTVPVWTPDQLALALVLTAYCLLAPRLKERRFQKRFGAEFDMYRARVPYAVPRLWPSGGPMEQER